MSRKEYGSAPTKHRAAKTNAMSDYAKSGVVSNARNRKVTRLELMQLHDECLYLYHNSATALYTTRLLVQAIMRKKKTYAAKAEQLRELIEKARREGAR